MNTWQVDFYYPPSQPGQDKQWELVICESNFNSLTKDGQPWFIAQCHSADANADWLTKQITTAAKAKLPAKIQVFRPQTLGLMTVVGEKLGIEIEATRNTAVLKQILQARHKNNPIYDPLALEKAPPQALPEAIWGDNWQIANIAAGQIVEIFSDRPIPIRSLPESLFPINLGIPSDIPIPGLVVFGGRKSMQIARWIQQNKPAFVNYIPTEAGKSGGFILETGLADRWVFNTFESEQAATIAKSYEEKKQTAKGLHFLLIQPDDSGMTYTAFWLLRQI